ncbi:hypothetical protein [Streptomyces albidus (ex Kaewkla and Franco 2022)]|uniref:hypothetical protein n=1 Tax=Streptomyces albidus (ex Kaewkla and Franco 2022) TaxID=722709 RepID=UPI0015EFB6A3|nr:hypothetical protein [Streptomyces albidus (ex Kaewkla and Franco 2022)]
MSDRPARHEQSPQDAASALENVHRQQDEALAGREEPLAMKIALSGVLVAFCASFDFVDDPSIVTTVFGVAFMIFVLVSKSRRGSALLGYDTTGPRFRSMPTEYRLILMALVFTLLTLGHFAVTPVMSFLRGHHVPYAHTLVGVTAAVLMFPVDRLDRRMRIRLLGRIRARNEGV